MKSIPMAAITPYRRALSTPSDNSPSSPHVSSSLSTVLVFASTIASLLLLGLYCRFSRRRSISNARQRLVHQLYVSIPSILMHRPANVSLPVRKYTKEEVGGDGKLTEECPVCLVEFEEGEEVKVVVPGCEHVFHPVCIDRWLAMRDTCPVCRSAVVSEETDAGDGWGEGGGMERMVVSGGRDGGEGGEGEAVVNAESVVVSGGRDDEEGEGEGEAVVNVESVVLSGERDEGEGGGGEVGAVGMNVESGGAEGRGGEVNWERSDEGVREDVRVDVFEGGEGESELHTASVAEVIEDPTEGENERVEMQRK